MTGLSGVFSGSGHKPVATSICSRTACRRLSQASLVAGTWKKKSLSLRVRSLVCSRLSAAFSSGRAGAAKSTSNKKGRYVRCFTDGSSRRQTVKFGSCCESKREWGWRQWTKEKKEQDED